MFDVYSQQSCRLCGSVSSMAEQDALRRQLYRCAECGYVFVASKNLLSQKEEKDRYVEHENSIEDARYVTFLSRLLDPLSSFLKYDDLVLDYGSGPEPVLAKLLENKGFDVFTYDPFFSPELHEAVYDGVTATESFEHFFEPRREIETIMSILAPRGVLGVMTLRYDETTDLRTWHYARDPTHIGFFSNKTFRWIESKFNLELIYDDGERVIIWRKKS